MTAHLYGWVSAALEPLRAVCRDAGIPLIEDGAQCFGTEIDGVAVLAGADCATTSFYPTKILGTCGNGGAVFCRDPALAGRLRQLHDYGRDGRYHHRRPGWNSRLCALHAGFLLLALGGLAPRLRARRGAEARYRHALAAVGIPVAEAPAGVTGNGYLNVLLPDAATHDRLRRALDAAGIGYGRVYPAPVSAQPGIVGHLAGRDGGETAASACAAVLNLPLFHGIDDDEIDRVVAVATVAAGQ